jgi:hypothetical protein
LSLFSQARSLSTRWTNVFNTPPKPLYGGQRTWSRHVSWCDHPIGGPLGETGLFAINVHKNIATCTNIQEQGISVLESSQRCLRLVNTVIILYNNTCNGQKFIVQTGLHTCSWTSSYFTEVWRVN